jgi:hypothetical protein
MGFNQNSKIEFSAGPVARGSAVHLIPDHSIPMSALPFVVHSEKQVQRSFGAKAAPQDDER